MVISNPYFQMNKYLFGGNMKYRLLGKTGLQISEIGLGCGGKFSFPENSDTEILRTTNLALDAGVNFLDTGSNYGMGLSEIRIGKLLKHRRQNFYLATKCGSHLILEEGKEPTVKRDFSYDGLISSVQDSLKRLQTDYVDVLQFHTASAKALEKNGEALAALLEMKKRGYCRFLGASCDGERAIEAINTGILDCIQISFSVAAQDPLQKILPLALKANVGVIVKEPVANVFFMGIPKPGEDYAWQHPTWERSQSFLFLKDINKPKPVQAALQFVLANPAVTTAIVASITENHMKENIEVPDLPALDEKLMKNILNTFKVKLA